LLHSIGEVLGGLSHPGWILSPALEGIPIKPNVWVIRRLLITAKTELR
jgi:hypothetical protein